EIPPEDVRDAGVVRAPHEIATVLREDEPGGHGGAEIVERGRRRVLGEERSGAEDLERLATVDLGARGRELRAVRRDVDVIDVATVGPGIDAVPGGVGRLEP